VAEGPEAKPEETNPAAIALAVGRSTGSADVDCEAAEFLRDQRRLVNLQIENLEEDRALQHRHLALKFFGDRLRIALELVAVAFGLALLLGLGDMAWQASQDHGLVIEAFSVPPDLAARGATGEAVAEDLMSRVAAIRSLTNRGSFSQSNEVRADQADALKVEIPQTGVSIGEIDHFLHRWLGHETLLTGEVRNEADGQISVGLHIAGADPIAVKGPAADFDRLMQETAEKAFATFDPPNYAVYLASSDRGPEALAAAEAYVLKTDLTDQSAQNRTGAYCVLANLDPDRRRGLSRALIAIDLDPRVMFGWREAAVAQAELGHDQSAVDLFRRALQTKIGDQPPSVRGAYAQVIDEGRILIDQATGDIGDLEGAFAADQQSTKNRYALSARAAAAVHDRARTRAQLFHALAAGPVNETILKTRWYVSSEAEDWPQAMADAKALVDNAQGEKAKAPGPAWADEIELRLATLYRPWLALAQAMNGDAASAAALIAASPLDCYLCARVRGQIAAVSGDQAGADGWFGQAVRQAPRLPRAYLEWGQTLLARGDLAGAAAKFALAHQWGPRFADPLKGWGDALARQGQRKPALAKYDEALTDVPAWKELRQARDATARHPG